MNQEVKEVAVISNPLNLPSVQEWGQIKEICKAAIASGMLPSGIKTPEAAAIIALKARELGIPLMQGFSHIVVINGKPGMSAELIQSMARKNLPGLIFNILESNDSKCIVEGKRPETGSLPLKITITMEAMQKAGVTTKDSWKNYPAAMLRARATTACLRALCPEALMGVSYTPEELGDDIPTTSRPIIHVETQEQQTPPTPAVMELEDPLRELRIRVKKEWEATFGTENNNLGFFVKENINPNAASLKDLSESELKQVLAYVDAQKDVK